jgi:hypothetical protein
LNVNQKRFVSVLRNHFRHADFRGLVHTALLIMADRPYVAESLSRLHGTVG